MPQFVDKSFFVSRILWELSDAIECVIVEKVSVVHCTGWGCGLVICGLVICGLVIHGLVIRGGRIAFLLIVCGWVVIVCVAVFAHSVWLLCGVPCGCCRRCAGVHR
jgi:hypothetical protein